MHFGQIWVNSLSVMLVNSDTLFLWYAINRKDIDSKSTHNWLGKKVWIGNEIKWILSLSQHPFQYLGAFWETLFLYLPQIPDIHRMVNCFFSKFKSGQNWVVFFDFKADYGTLRFNVPIESVKKMSGIIFRENIYFVYLSHFLYNSYGARFLFEIF